MNKIYLNNCRYITLFILLTTLIFSQDVQSTKTDLPKNTEPTVSDEIKEDNSTPLVSIHAEDTHLPSILAI